MSVEEWVEAQRILQAIIAEGKRVPRSPAGRTQINNARFAKVLVVIMMKLDIIEDAVVKKKK